MSAIVCLRTRGWSVTAGSDREAAILDIADEQLLQQLHAGDQQAATAIYVRYADKLLGVARRHTAEDLRMRFDPEDVVQSVFRTFFRRAAQGAYVVPAGDDLWKLFLVIALNKVRRLGEFHRANKRSVGQTSLLNDPLVEQGKQVEDSLDRKSVV